MIRDEFKKEQEIRKSSGLALKKETLRERSYYTAKLGKGNKTLKSYSFLTKFCIVVGIILLIPIILTIVLNIPIAWNLITIMIVEAVCIAYILIWYFLWKPHILKTNEYCKEKLNEIKIIELNKQKGNYLKNIKNN